MSRGPGDTIDLGITGITDAAEIGSGGFGVVYRAVEADLGRTVAVKVLSGNLDDAARYRFERERRAMGRLSGHPNIVTVYRGGYTEAGNAYLVMEFLDRGSLADRLAAVGPLGWEEAVKFAIQLSGALETSHRAGVLHRDIKPGNILLSSLGNAKLCDFGIARLQGAPETKSSVITASLSHAPPDIVSGARPDARSDVYSLASTMFELVAATPPFVRPTDESMVPILARIAQDPVPKLPETQLPGAVFEVVERAMAKEPTERPATAAEFGQLLVSAQIQMGQPPTPIPIEAVAGPADDGTGRSYIPFPETESGPLPAPRTSSPSDRGAPTAHGGVTGTSGTGPAPPTVVTGAGASDVSSAAERTAISDQHDPSAWAPPVGQQASTSGPTAVDPSTSGPTTIDPSTSGPTGPATSGDWERPSSEPPGRPPWLLPALAAAAVVVVLGGLAALLLSGGDDEPDAGGPTSTTEAGNPEVTETTDVTFAGSGGDDYPTYVSVTDDTGSITLSIPTEWSDVQTQLGTNDLPLLSAAPLLEGGFFGTVDEPGVQVAVDDVTTNADLDGALDVLAELFIAGTCTAAGRENVGTPYIGRIERFTDCDGTDTQLVHIAFIDSTNNLTAIMRIQILSDRDLVAADTIRQSLRLKDNVPG